MISSKLVLLQIFGKGTSLKEVKLCVVMILYCSLSFRFVFINVLGNNLNCSIYLGERVISITLPNANEKMVKISIFFGVKYSISDITGLDFLGN